MKTLAFAVTPQSPFGTPLAGDTLFGQLCWVLRYQQGEERLEALLEGYTRGQPFAVISDAFPTGYVLRPTVPFSLLATANAVRDRKALKAKQWLPWEAIRQPSSHWLARLAADPAGSEAEKPANAKSEREQRRFVRTQWQMHNQIDRRTGTTGAGEEGFAPFSSKQRWYAEDATLDIHVCYDPERIEADVLVEALRTIGQTGYGADASIGLGRFCLREHDRSPLKPAEPANAWLTLAPCVPQKQGFVPEGSWYQICTRFGRHGSIGALNPNPFKNPVLMARSGAVFAPDAFEPRPFIGCGLGQDNMRLSYAIPNAVHQGYAPVIGVNWVAQAQRLS